MFNNFLQSEEWRKFQEAFGRKTFCVSRPHPNPLPQAGEVEFDFYASIIEHTLPIVGNYFYIPRGPIIEKQGIDELINLAEKEKVGWMRFDPENQKALEIIKKSTNLKIIKAPHDVQPKEILVLDISKNEEEILAQMKSKARYNIRLAEKKGISLRITNKYEYTNGNRKDFNEFLRLTKIMAKRQGITPHPDEYYTKMLEIIPAEMLKLYVAEYEGRVIAANLMVFFGDTATYLHGASDDDYRNVMAPYLLQWRAIQEAKQKGCTKYDFGGVKTTLSSSTSPTSPSIPLLRKEREVGSWSGITRFKIGFAPNTKPIEFPGSYDIVISPMKYWLYRFIQKIKSIL